MGSAFTDPGYTARDDVDGIISLRVFVEGLDEIDTSRPTLPNKPWVMSYHVSDSSGNNAVVRRRRVYVVCPSGESVCSSWVLAESPEMSLIQRVSCSVSGVCDESGGELFGSTMLSGDVAVGDLIITEDGIGSRQQGIAASTPTRHPPQLALIGPQTVTLTVGMSYPACESSNLTRVCDAGVYAVDSLQGLMSSRIVACLDTQLASGIVPPIPFAVGGLLPCNLDTGRPGKVNITFSVTNDAGLTSAVNRTIVIAPICGNGERLCAGLLTCSTDRLCDLIEDFVDSKVVEQLLAGEGETVEDNPPTIELQGPSVISLPSGSVWDLCPDESDKEIFCDQGAIASDVEDGDLTSSILACPPRTCTVDGIACKSHLLSVKGITPCLPSNVDALPVGTKVLLPFTVFDYGIPPLNASISRTLVIVSSCEPGEYNCDGVCSEIACEVRNKLGLGDEIEEPQEAQISLLGPELLEVKHGLPSTEIASLLPCLSISAAQEPSGEAPHSCGCTATVENSEGTPADVSQYLTIQQNCTDCAVCLPKAAVQGLCPLGTYRYEYSLSGFVSSSVFRSVSIFTTSFFSVDITFVPAADLSKQYILDLQALSSPSTTQQEAAVYDFKLTILGGFWAGAQAADSSVLLQYASALTQDSVTLASVDISAARVVVTAEVHIKYLGDYNAAEDFSAARRRSLLAASEDVSNVDAFTSAAARALQTALSNSNEVQERVVSSLTDSLSLLYSGMLALPSDVTISAWGSDFPDTEQVVAEQMLYLEGALEHLAQAYATAIGELERSMSLAVLSGTQEQAARDASLTAAMEEYQAMHDETMAGASETFQSALDVYRSVGSSRTGLAEINKIAAAGEDLFTAHTNELSEVLTKLQLGGADFREGSVGYALWGVLQEIENDKCLGRSVNYNITFEARSNARPSGSDAAGRRHLLATSGASGSSKGGKLGSQYVVTDAAWGGYNIILANRSLLAALPEDDVPPRQYTIGHGSSRTRLLTGMLVHQQRRALVDDPEHCSFSKGTRFYDLSPVCSSLAFLQQNLEEGPEREAMIAEFLTDPLSPFGTDPVFMVSSELYNPAAALREAEFYNTTKFSDDMNFRNAPYGYFPGNISTLPPGFFVVVDSAMDNGRAAQVWKGMSDGAWIDSKTHKMKARLMTVHNDGGMGMAELNFEWDSAGMISATTQVLVADTWSLASMLQMPSRVALLALQAAIAIGFAVLVLYEMTRAKLFNAAHACLALLLLAGSGLQVVFYLRANEVSLLPYYTLYDAPRSSIARWWMPIKDSSKLQESVLDSPSLGNDTTDDTLPGQRGDPFRWKLPKNVTGTDAFGESMQDIQALVDLQTWMVICQVCICRLIVAIPHQMQLFAIVSLANMRSISQLSGCNTGPCNFCLCLPLAGSRLVRPQDGHHHSHAGIRYAGFDGVLRDFLHLASADRFNGPHLAGDLPEEVLDISELYGGSVHMHGGRRSIRPQPSGQGQQCGVFCS